MHVFFNTNGIVSWVGVGVGVVLNELFCHTLQCMYIATSLISLTNVEQLLNFYYGNGFDL